MFLALIEELSRHLPTRTEGNKKLLHETYARNLLTRMKSFTHSVFLSCAEMLQGL
jgi:hypothetical protein